MKNRLFTMITVIFMLNVVLLFSQIQIRHLPYYMDINFANKPADYVHQVSNDLNPVPTPAWVYKMKPAPARIQTKSGIELINISNAPSHQSETYIKVNPKNPNNIVVGSNDYRYNSRSSRYKMVAFYSNDAGNTWSQSTTPGNLDLGMIGYPQNGGCTNVDPGIGFDSEGNVYYVYLFAQLIDGQYTSDNGVFVVKSYDGAKTWSDEDIGIPVLKTNGALQDKCFIGVDSDPNSPYKNRSYVAWFDTKYPFAVGFAYAEDGINFNSANSVAGSTGKSIQSPLPVVGPNGILYIVWEEKSSSKTKAVVQKSTDGGVTWAWASPHIAQLVNTSGVLVGNRLALPDKGDMRIGSAPSMAIDPNNGNMYVVQAGKSDNGKYGVFLSKSTDKGETWTAGDNIENLYKVDGNTFGNDVFLPSITVDPKNGMLAILYYSSENDTENNKGCDAFVAVSFDEGKTFKHIQLTDTWYFNNSSVIDAGGDNLGRYWGDYTSIDAYNGHIYPCFWMPTTSDANFWSCDLFTAKLSTAPETVTNLKAENSWETPSKITITWTDPVKNKLGGDLKDFKVYIYKSGNKIDEVNKGVQTYTYNDLKEGEKYSFSLKVHEISFGLESPFATISGVAGGVLEPKLPTEIMARPNENGILLSWLNPVEHTDDSYLQDLNSIEIYVDGELFKTVNKPSIQAGEVSSELLELSTGTFYKIQLKAKTKRGNSNGESKLSDEIMAYAGAPLTQFSENFDDTDNLTPFYISDGWGITDKTSKTSPNCLTDSPDGNYKGNSDNYIIFAPTVIEAGKSTLQMDHIALIAVQDYGKIKISNDFGASYKSLKWINVKRSNLWDQTSFKLENSQWFEDGFDLSEYAGDTIMVMFELTTTPFVNKDGWYIDDVKIGDFPVGVDDYSNLGQKINLSLAPNPVTNEARVNFNLPFEGRTIVALYDVIGNKVKQIEDNNLVIGEHNYTINFSDLAIGSYYLRLSVNGNTQVIPIIVKR